MALDTQVAEHQHATSHCKHCMTSKMATYVATSVCAKPSCNNDWYRSSSTSDTHSTRGCQSHWWMHFISHLKLAPGSVALCKLDPISKNWPKVRCGHSFKGESTFARLWYTHYGKHICGWLCNIYRSAVFGKANYSISFIRCHGYYMLCFCSSIWCVATIWAWHLLEGGLESHT